jgi:hypothetical protein
VHFPVPFDLTQHWVLSGLKPVHSRILDIPPCCTCPAGIYLRHFAEPRLRASCNAGRHPPKPQIFLEVLSGQVSGQDSIRSPKQRVTSYSRHQEFSAARPRIGAQELKSACFAAPGGSADAVPYPNIS